MSEGDLFRKRFDRFFEDYWKSVVALFRRHGCSQEDAVDLGQETFLEIWQSLRRYKENNPKAWVLKIAQRVLQNWWRSNNAQKRSAEEVPLGELEGGDLGQVSAWGDAPDPERDLLSREQLKRTCQVIKELPPRMGQCLRLRMQDFNGKEIASVLQIKEATVNSQLSQAKKRLQVALEESPEDLQEERVLEAMSGEEGGSDG